MDNTTVDKPELESKNEASQELLSSEQVIVKPEQTIPLAPDLTSPEVFSVTEKEPQVQSTEVSQSSQVATPVVEVTEPAVGQVAPVIESETRTTSTLPVEQLPNILNGDEDLTKGSAAHDALEQILNSSESGS